MAACPGVDPFDLARFVTAQDPAYSVALAELRAGRKRSHWMWYVFPQLRGLGSSSLSWRYGVSGAEEATAYLAHRVLGPRLRESVEALLSTSCRDAAQILGELDALKFRSCLTLFHAVSGEALFDEALERFFAGARDPRTLAALASGGRS